MLSAHPTFRLFVTYSLIFSLSEVALCSSGAPAMALFHPARHEPAPADHLPCKCDMSEAGCCCGAACCCNRAAPKESPTSPDQTKEQRTLRPPLVLQTLANTEPQLILGPRSVDTAAATTLVTLTPTLQLEHVRIQT